MLSRFFYRPTFIGQPEIFLRPNFGNSYDILVKMMEMQELDGIDDEKAEFSGKVFSIEKQKRFVEFQKDAKKYVIFVVALPLIGVIGLVIYSALSYEYGMNSNNM